MMRNIIITLCLACLCSCGGGNGGFVSEGGDTLDFKYARLLTVVRHKDYTEAAVADPWHEGRLLHRYVLVDKRKPLPKSLPEGTVVRTPVSRSVVFTSAHAQLLSWMGAADGIVGVCDANFILSKDIRQLLTDRKIADCGNGMAPMIERIVSLNADALLLSPFENSGGYGRLEKIGTPIIECADYMEPTALGRAEWMRLYGMLYGCEHSADSLFRVVDSSYTALRQTAARLSGGASVITERLTGSTWYVPGGKSVIAQAIKDAGGSYPFANDTHSGSLSLAAEQVIDMASACEVWAFKYSGDRPLSRGELLTEYHGYANLAAMNGGRVYECASSHVPYFDEVPFRPDYLLRELIAMLHPELGWQLKYYECLSR